MAEVQPWPVSNVDLCTVADVREYINSKTGLTIVGPDDNIIQRLITSFSNAVDSYCSRRIMAQQYTENRNGRGEMAMQVKNAPIVAVQSLTIDGTTVPLSTSPLSGGYVADDRFIYLRDNGYGAGYTPAFFNWGFLNITFQYWAGYQTAGQIVSNVVFPAGITPLQEPLDLWQAAVETVYLTLRQRPRLGDESIGVGPQRMQYFLKWMTDASQQAVNRYINHAVPLT